jgi:spore coat polysaccharide biosynthesis protein SpsF
LANSKIPSSGCRHIPNRAFPRGLDVEAFTAASFVTVCERATEPQKCEHVTPYYHEQADYFERVSVTAGEVFAEP